MKKDPVCGMSVDEKKFDKLSYKGTIFYFCNPACKWAFINNPKQFVK